MPTKSVDIIIIDTTHTHTIAVTYEIESRCMQIYQPTTEYIVHYMVHVQCMCRYFILDRGGANIIIIH